MQAKHLEEEMIVRQSEYEQQIVSTGHTQSSSHVCNLRSDTSSSSGVVETPPPPALLSLLFLLAAFHHFLSTSLSPPSTALPHQQNVELLEEDKATLELRIAELMVEIEVAQKGPKVSRTCHCTCCLLSY